MIVLDTHALVWWVSGSSELSRKAGRAIAAAQEAGDVVVSAISSWEVAQLVARGKLALSMDVASWFELVSRVDGVRVQAVDVAAFIESVQLPGDFHKDPADRVLVATARALGATLVTRDEKIRAYPHIKTLW